MQFHLDGFQPGDPDIADPVARIGKPGSPGTLSETTDVLIVGCGPAGLTLGAQLSAFADIKTCIVEQKPDRLLRGNGIDKPLLVTSALHMPRAVREFARAGMSVTPAPTDFEVADAPQDVLQWLPSADALESSGRAFKELLGLLHLWMRP